MTDVSIPDREFFRILDANGRGSDTTGLGLHGFTTTFDDDTATITTPLDRARIDATIGEAVPWTDVALSNAVATTGEQAPQGAMSIVGAVAVRGSLTPTVTGTQTKVVQLPPELVPATGGEQHIPLAAHDGSTRAARIDSTGAVFVDVVNGAPISLDGLQFIGIERGAVVPLPGEMLVIASIEDYWAGGPVSKFDGPLTARANNAFAIPPDNVTTPYAPLQPRQVNECTTCRAANGGLGSVAAAETYIEYVGGQAYGKRRLVIEGPGGVVYERPLVDNPPESTATGAFAWAGDASGIYALDGAGIFGGERHILKYAPDGSDFDVVHTVPADDQTGGPDPCSAAGADGSLWWIAKKEITVAPWYVYALSHLSTDGVYSERSLPPQGDYWSANTAVDPSEAGTVLIYGIGGDGSQLLFYDPSLNTYSPMHTIAFMYVGTATWSLDGRWIACAVSDEGGRVVKIIDSTSLEVHHFADVDAYPVGMGWL